MGSRTKLYQQLPWQGGLNTSQDESMIPGNQLTIANNIVFAERGSRKKRDGNKHNWDDVTTGTVPIIGLHDFWYGTSSKTQKIVSIGNNRSIRTYSTAGAATTLTDAGTAWSTTLTSCSLVTYNNLCIMAVSGAGNVLKKWSGSGDVADLDGTPPQASILRQHLGRLFTNDKTNLDRLHYSPVHDHTQWNGAGDSGAIDIGIGDGDAEGITAIFPTFKGDLFVAKRSKLYRVITSSNDPAEWDVKLVSSGIGCVSHNSIIAVDQDDIYFVSDRGIHSLVTTANFGDYEAQFVSLDIQKSFRDVFSQGRLKQIWGAYDGTINSIAFAVTENTISSSDEAASRSLYGSSAPVTVNLNNAIWLYNIQQKAWYRHPGISCQSLISVRDGSDNKQRFFLGTHISRVTKTKSGTNYDISHAGVNTAIPFRIKTGIIFCEQNPYMLYNFKRFLLYYKPFGTQEITVTFKVDNQTISNENQLSFNELSGSDLLGTTFILGSSILGFSTILGPYSRTVDGVGHGFQVELTQSGVDQAGEFQGFAVEYEPLSVAGSVV